MSDRSISSRYAKVLFDLDGRDGKYEERLKDFDFILNSMKAHPQFEKLLRSPQLPVEEKKTVLHKLFKDSFDQRLMDFLFYLLQKGRLAKLKPIAKSYRHMANEHLGMWEANIITAVPMDAESEKRLVAKLEKEFQKKIHLNKKVDPQIIGGAILVVSNEMVDGSVRGRLKKLKEHLIGAHV